MQVPEKQLLSQDLAGELAPLRSTRQSATPTPRYPLHTLPFGDLHGEMPTAPSMMDGRLQGSSRHPKLGGDPLQADTGSPPVTQDNSSYALSEHAELHLFRKCGPGQKQINFDQACTQLK